MHPALGHCVHSAFEILSAKSVKSEEGGLFCAGTKRVFEIVVGKAGAEQAGGELVELEKCFCPLPWPRSCNPEPWRL